jgi:hypothetical protein
LGFADVANASIDKKNKNFIFIYINIIIKYSLYSLYCYFSTLPVNFNIMINKYILICLLAQMCLSISICDRTCRHGKCIDGDCICNTCYIGKDCDYRQAKTWVAFIWEFILPIGPGHLYSGNFLIALVKFMLMIGMLCYPYIYTIYSVRNAISQDDQYVMITDVGVNVLSLKVRIIKSKALLLLIFVTDLVLILMGFYKDGNRIALC